METGRAACGCVPSSISSCGWTSSSTAAPALRRGWAIDRRQDARGIAGRRVDRSGGHVLLAAWSGFSGSFDLSFVRTDCDGRKERVPVRVTIDK